MTELTRMISTALLVLSIAVPGGGQPAGIDETGSLEQVDRILQGYVQALGGYEALAGLKTRVCKGTETTDLRSRERPIYEAHWLEAYAKSSGRHLTVIGTDAGTEYTGFDGDVGWHRDRCGVREDQYASHSKLGYILDPQGPLRIDDYFPGLTFGGLETLEGRTVYVLVPSGLKKAHYSLSFDCKTGLLVRIGYYTDIREYREVDGVLFPHRIISSRKGGYTMYEFEEVAHNGEIEDSVFAMPIQPE